MSEGKPTHKLIFFLFVFLMTFPAQVDHRVTKGKGTVGVARVDRAMTHSAFSECQNQIKALNSDGPREIHQDSKYL